MPLDPTKATLEKDFTAEAPLTACRFSPDGRFVFAGAQDSRVWRFDVESGAKTELAGTYQVDPGK